jgi:hypothetical protein
VVFDRHEDFQGYSGQTKGCTIRLCSLARSNHIQKPAALACTLLLITLLSRCSCQMLLLNGFLSVLLIFEAGATSWAVLTWPLTDQGLKARIASSEGCSHLPSGAHRFASTAFHFLHCSCQHALVLLLVSLTLDYERPKGYAKSDTSIKTPFVAKKIWRAKDSAQAPINIHLPRAHGYEG